MAIITVKIDHETKTGRHLINQIRSMQKHKLFFKILYETCNNSEILVDEYIRQADEFFDREKENQYNEMLYDFNSQERDDTTFVSGGYFI